MQSIALHYNTVITVIFYYTVSTQCEGECCEQLG